MNAAMLSRKICQFELQPCRNSSAGPRAAGVEHVDPLAVEVERALERRPVDAHPRRVVAVGVRRVRARPEDRVAHHGGHSCACGRHVASYRINGSAMNIAIDIDSTLHHYWDQLSDAAQRRFGIALPYEEQVTWGITLLRPEQVRACVEETHSDAAGAGRRALPGRGRGRARLARRRPLHPHHLAPRHGLARRHASAGCGRIGLPYDELYCSYDKVTRCREIGIDLLIDDSPVNLEAALDAGITAATLLHPVEPRAVRDRGRDLRLATGTSSPRNLAPVLDVTRRARSRPPAAATTCATTCRRSSPSGRSATGAAPSAWRASSTPRSRRSSTTTGSAARSRGSSTSRPRAAPARLQPRRRAAARRVDDRQGDPGGAPAPAQAAPDGRALLQGLSVLQHVRGQDRRRARPPGERAPAALRRAAARARVPGGREGDGEALQGPLPAAPLRPRRLRRGGDARAASRSCRSRSSARRRRCRRSRRSACSSG